MTPRLMYSRRLEALAILTSYAQPFVRRQAAGIASMGQMALPIVDLKPEAADLIDQASRLLLDAFRNRTEDWQDIESARLEVLESLPPDRISRVLTDESGTVLGWIGGIPTYRGRVWEVHPLVVSRSHRRQGIGRALVEDLERLVALRGALTLWAG